MNAKQFYDWQTAGGVNDVTLLVECLEQAAIPWCAIGGIAVNHWAQSPMVTQEVEFVVSTSDIDRTRVLLEEAGFRSETFDWTINFKGNSIVSLQLSSEALYRDFPSRSVHADVHGMLLRVASLEDTLTGKIAAWSDSQRRQSKRMKDLADIGRLVEAHPKLWEKLTDALKSEIDQPPSP
jgi:hypothetical protein